MIRVVGIIRVLPFWDFIDFRQQCQLHTNRSGLMELFCRVSSVSLFLMCKFPVFKDWIVESFGWIIFRDILRVALMRLRSINVAAIFNTFLHIWKFLCIDERLNVLFVSLSSIELIISIFIQYRIYLFLWAFHRTVTSSCHWHSRKLFSSYKIHANDNKIARIAFSCLVFHTRYDFLRHQNRPCFKNGGLKMTLRIKSYLFLCYFHRVFITLKMQRWLVFRTPF